jgi:L-amino acid N-acyltransferase YncA
MLSGRAMQPVTSTREALIIRQAELKDLDSMVAAWKEGARQALGLDAPSNIDFRLFFREKIKNQNDSFKVWVEENEVGELLGWQALFPCRNNPAVMHLMAESSTYISPRFQGKGVARRLLSHALKEAQKTPLQWIIGFSSSENKAIISLALSLGFELGMTLPPTTKEPKQPELALLLYKVPSLHSS